MLSKFPSVSIMALPSSGRPIRMPKLVYWVVLVLAGAIRQQILRTAAPPEYGSCDGCFCVPDEGDSCPLERLPRTNFDDMIPTLRTLKWTNSVSLDCDPYKESYCQMEPALQEGGACVVDYHDTASSEPSDWSYSLRTYSGTVEEAMAEGEVITHAGACGACSSLQDLAAYMEQGASMRDSSTMCGIRGRFSALDGVQCFREIGFTDACANIWYYNTEQTSKHCMHLCVPFVLSGAPPNDSGPMCPLTECIECDEIYSGPIFQQFAGRTRRNSGLRSSIIRPCSQMVPLEQRDPRKVVMQRKMGQGRNQTDCVSPNHRTGLIDHNISGLAISSM